VCPEENHIVGSTIERFESISRSLGEIKVGQMANGLTELRSQVITCRSMVWVPKHANVWMQGFKGVSGMLKADK
jgi:hypothetical protein